MATASQLLKTVFDGAVGKHVIAQGFSESPPSGRHPLCPQQYERRLPRVMQFVDVQRDKYWTSSGGKFCINLRISLDELRSLYPNSDRLWGPGPSERLGRLATGEDYWWSFSQSARLDELIEQIGCIWRKFGDPWFCHRQDLRSVRDITLEEADLWKRGYAIPLSVALGEVGVARRLAIDLMKARDRPNDNWLTQLTDWNVVTDQEASIVRRLAMQHIDSYLSGLDDLFTG